MGNAASPTDRRRHWLLLRVSGFASLALALLGSFACIALTVVAIVNALGEFQTVDVPGTAVLALGQRHYVIYYEDPVALPGLAEVQGLRVSIRPTLPISAYRASFTYNLGPPQTPPPPGEIRGSLSGRPSSTYCIGI